MTRMKKKFKKRVTLLMASALIVSQICMNADLVFVRAENEAVADVDSGGGSSVDDSSGNSEETPGENPSGNFEETPGENSSENPEETSGENSSENPEEAPSENPSDNPEETPSDDHAEDESSVSDNTISDESKDKTDEADEADEAETTDITITVMWDDDNDRAEARPEEVLVYVYADGEEEAYEEVNVTKEEAAEDGGWEHSLSLPKYVAKSESAEESEAENGDESVNNGEGEKREAVYTISQEPIEGYEEPVVEGYTITNKYITPLLPARMPRRAATFNGDADFTYYTNPDEKSSCSKDEINEVIKNAESGTTIELNNDVELNSSLVFDGSKSYTLDLKGHTLTVVSGFQAIKITYGPIITVSNGTVRGANTTTASGVWNKRGAGIFCRNATLTIDNLTVTENVADGYGGGIYTTGGTFKAINSAITNNVGTTSGGGLSLNDTTVSFTNCEVSGNEQSGNYSTRVGGIYVYSATVTADNLRVVSNGINSAVEDGGIYVQNGDVTLNNSTVSGNKATVDKTRGAGGIGIQSGSVTLNNTVVTDNIGYKAGGINAWDSNSTLNVSGGSIYNNKANEPYTSTFYANDIMVQQTAGNISASVPAASEMLGEGYYWAYTYVCGNEEVYKELNSSITVDSTTSKTYHLYNASNEPSRSVAEVLSSGERFTTIAEAIENAAANGDTIRLVANGAISETVTISDEKSITIDLNDRKWSGADAASKALTIEGGANVTITGNGTLNEVSHGGASLVLDSASVNTIYLETGKFVEAGPNFANSEMTNEITFVLSTEDHKKLDTQDVILIDAAEKLSNEVARKIVIRDADPLVVIIANADGDIVARKMTGVFVNGQSGSDTNSGLDVNSPVKTFARAKEVFESLSEEGKKKAEGIFVTGTITVTGNEEWSLSEASLLRYKGLTGYLVDVKGGELTLKDITMDGQGDKVEASNAIIKVSSGGNINIYEGTKLTNNKHTKQRSYVEGGGAIYCESGHINMSGGEISGNTSWYGAGVELWGTDATMLLDGGFIINNKAVMVSDDSAAGGGIAIMAGATLTMNGGEVLSNESTDSQSAGGGIMVGNIRMYNGIKGSTFIMNGGKLNSNKANGFAGSGGAIYVQCGSNATLNGGELNNNSCGEDRLISGMSGVYGGGAIYVNGGREGYEDGKLYIPSVYISGNTAKHGDGAGIAGCGTSTVYVYPYSATIYQNNGTSQIYVDSTQESGFATRAKVFISEFAAGGGINHWTDKDGEVPADRLQNLQPGTKLVISNPNAENLDVTGSLAAVKITGNMSYTRGGGIGTNGYVEIGTKQDEPEFVKVEGEKTWKDNNNQDGIRPTSIIVYLLANGERIAEKVVNEADDDWKWSFTWLPKQDVDGKGIVYTVEEEPVKGYETKVDGYNVTNTHTPKEPPRKPEPPKDKKPEPPKDKEPVITEKVVTTQTVVNKEVQPKGSTPKTGEDATTIACAIALVICIVLILVLRSKRRRNNK